MPYLYEKMSLNRYRSVYAHGTDVPADVQRDTAVVEWWASAFSDPGPDYNLFKFVDAKGEVIHTVREDGY